MAPITGRSPGRLRLCGVHRGPPHNRGCLTVPSVRTESWRQAFGPRSLDTREGGPGEKWRRGKRLSGREHFIHRVREGRRAGHGAPRRTAHPDFLPSGAMDGHPGRAGKGRRRLGQRRLVRGAARRPRPAGSLPHVRRHGQGRSPEAERGTHLRNPRGAEVPRCSRRLPAAGTCRAQVRGCTRVADDLRAATAVRGPAGQGRVAGLGL